MGRKWEFTLTLTRHNKNSLSTSIFLCCCPLVCWCNLCLPKHHLHGNTLVSHLTVKEQRRRQNHKFMKKIKFLETSCWPMITLKLGSDLTKQVSINTEMFSSPTWNVTHFSRFVMYCLLPEYCSQHLKRIFDIGFKIKKGFQIKWVWKIFVILTVSDTVERDFSHSHF